ncbi:TonB-dependent receptor [Phenylobacterium sp.]|uniref:TonB-dependent receptor n=1 Tax=Phenylobacterium sp. TaxID=1871053 RepID=UPI00121EE0E3|nr:TonB-dependent receptor [Phenylobacterium sp.]THD63889.1 MAG: TonB-dependent receptor [Phenylobacterium sp.]
MADVYMRALRATAVACCVVLKVSAASAAETDGASAASAAVDSVVVTAKKADEIGGVESASGGVVGGIELSQRPILRQGELLEAVPGMIVTAHTSGGKANQYYLRGFNLDHGTDFATSVDGVPVNMGSHAHGQGYMDLNWLMPELVAGIAFRKGPYYADAGDFSAAGNASISYLSKLPSNFAQVEVGTDDYERALVAGSLALGPGQLLYAGEYIHYDGPSTVPGNYRRPNELLKYTVGDEQVGGGVTAQAYDARWVASDQIPVRALPTLDGGRFGSIDPTSTGHTSRYSLAGEWHWGSGNITNQVEAYVVKYGLNLYSDFSDFVDQVHGDQFRQYDNRTIVGGSGRTTLTGNYLGESTEDSFGVQTRNDFVNLELDHTEARTIIQLERADQVRINSLAAYWSNAIVWTPWLRTEAGLRLEGYHFNLDSNTAANSGETTLGRPAPKIGVTITPRPDVDLYAQAGISYRSNDARGIFDTVPSYPGGPEPTERSKPLVRSDGAEIGARVRSLPGLTSTIAFWYLQSNSELFFAGDAGADEDTDRAGHRYGVELNNIYYPWRWLTLDADFALSQAFFSDRDPVVGNQIPEAIKSSASVAVILHGLDVAPGFTGSLRMRYFGARDLTADGSQRSAPVTVFNARVTYDLTPRLTLGVEALNLFNTKYNDAEYYDSSRLKGEPANPNSDDGSYLGHVIHPGEPLEIRLSANVKY